MTWVNFAEREADHREFAERVGVELPTLVRLLSRLEKEKLVARRSLGSKGHAKSVVLNARGRESLATMARVERTRKPFVEALDEEMMTKGLESLDRLLAQYATVLDWRGQRPPPPR